MQMRKVGKMVSLTTSQAANLLHVNQSRIRQMILAEQIKATKIGRDWLIDESEIKRVQTTRKVGRPKRKGRRPTHFKTASE